MGICVCPAPPIPPPSLHSASFINQTRTFSSSLGGRNLPPCIEGPELRCEFELHAHKAVKRRWGRRLGRRLKVSAMSLPTRKWPCRGHVKDRCNVDCTKCLWKKHSCGLFSWPSCAFLFVQETPRRPNCFAEVLKGVALAHISAGLAVPVVETMSKPEPSLINVKCMETTTPAELRVATLTTPYAFSERQIRSCILSFCCVLHTRSEFS